MKSLDDLCYECNITRNEYVKIKNYIDACAQNKVNDDYFNFAIFENEVYIILKRNEHYDTPPYLLKWCLCEAPYPLNKQYAMLFKKLYLDMPKYKNDTLLVKYIDALLGGKDVPYKGKY